jgi:hypothetical protein
MSIKKTARNVLFFLLLGRVLENLSCLFCGRIELTAQLYRLGYHFFFSNLDDSQT